MASLFQNPNPHASRLNPNALPYLKLQTQFPLSPPLVVSYSPQYVYHQHYPVQLFYYNPLKQPFTATLVHPQASCKEAECFGTQARPLSPKKFRPFFPRYDIMDKDFGAEKERIVKHEPRLRSKRRVLWNCKLEKEKSFLAKKGLGGSKVISDHVVDSSLDKINASVMIRNIPNKFGRHDLLEILDKHCLEQNKIAKLHCDDRRSKYDFLYLPMDFKTRANLGYAFVNFTSQIAASRFRDAFHRYKWPIPDNKKICEVSNAVIQGKDALRNHFRNSVFPCNTNDYLPVVFSPPRNGSNCPRYDIVGRRLNTSIKSS